LEKADHWYALSVGGRPPGRLDGPPAASELRPNRGKVVAKKHPTLSPDHATGEELRSAIISMLANDLSIYFFVY
jgi:hypothetical protein